MFRRTALIICLISISSGWSKTYAAARWTVFIVGSSRISVGGF